MEVNLVPIDEGARHGRGPGTVCANVYLSPNSSKGAVGVLPRRMSSGSCGFPFSHTRSMDRSGAHRLWEMSAGIAVQSPGFMWRYASRMPVSRRSEEHTSELQ